MWVEGYQDCELRGQQRRPQETRLSFSKDTKRTQVSGALSSPAEDLLCHLQVCFETYKATNLRQHAAQCLGRQGYRLVLHTPDSLGPLLGCSGIHRPCFPCPGGWLCWEHQEAQTAGKSLGSMSWLLSHGCISLQVFKSRSSHCWAFGKWLADRGNLIAASTGKASQLGTWVSFTSFCILNSGNPLFFSMKLHGFSATEEGGRDKTSHSVAHRSVKRHLVQSIQNGCSCSSVTFRNFMERKKAEDAGFCTLFENPADSHLGLLAEQSLKGELKRPDSAKARDRSRWTWWCVCPVCLSSSSPMLSTSPMLHTPPSTAGDRRWTDVNSDLRKFQSVGECHVQRRRELSGKRGQLFKRRANKCLAQHNASGICSASSPHRDTVKVLFRRWGA